MDAQQLDVSDTTDIINTIYVDTLSGSRNQTSTQNGKGEVNKSQIGLMYSDNIVAQSDTSDLQSEQNVEISGSVQDMLHTAISESQIGPEDAADQTVNIELYQASTPVSLASTAVSLASTACAYTGALGSILSDLSYAIPSSASQTETVNYEMASSMLRPGPLCYTVPSSMSPLYSSTHDVSVSCTSTYNYPVSITTPGTSLSVFSPSLTTTPSMTAMRADLNDLSPVRQTHVPVVAPSVTIPQCSAATESVQSTNIKNNGVITSGVSEIAGTASRGQCSSEDPSVIDVHGLKILADVVSHSSCIERTPSNKESKLVDSSAEGQSTRVTMVTMDNQSVSGTNENLLDDSDVLSDNPPSQEDQCIKPPCATEPQITKESRQGHLELAFPHNVLEACRLLYKDQVLLMTSAGIISGTAEDESELKVELRKHNTGLIMVLHGCCIESSLQGNTCNNWKCFVKSINSAESSHLDVDSFLRAAKIKTCDVFTQVSPDNFTQVSPENFTQVSPENFTQVSPENFTQVSPENFTLVRSCAVGLPECAVLADSAQVGVVKCAVLTETADHSVTKSKRSRPPKHKVMNAIRSSEPEIIKKSKRLSPRYIRELGGRGLYEGMEIEETEVDRVKNVTTTNCDIELGIKSCNNDNESKEISCKNLEKNRPELDKSESFVKLEKAEPTVRTRSKPTVRTRSKPTVRTRSKPTVRTKSKRPYKAKGVAGNDDLRTRAVSDETETTDVKMLQLNLDCEEATGDMSKNHRENGMSTRKKSKVKILGHYEHSLKTDRSLNRSLYELNREVAGAMKYDLPGEGLDHQVCVICGNESNLRWLLLVHLRRFHRLDPDKYYEILKLPAEERTQKLESLREVNGNAKLCVPKMAGTLPCDYCGEEFCGIRNMKRHLKLKHGSIAKAEMLEKTLHYSTEYRKLIHRNRMVAIRKVNLTKTEYPCRYCSLLLAMSCTRSRHEMYTCRKNPNRKKRFHCNYCGTAYRTWEMMESHQAKHAQHDYKYVCDICGKECKTKPMLYEHKMKEHNGRKPRYPCPICAKSFHYKDKLHKHLLSHSDKRDVMCDVCGKLFKTKADVQKHTKHVHLQNYPYHCDKCGHGVAKMAYLQSHKCGRVRRSHLNTPAGQVSQNAKKTKGLTGKAGVVTSGLEFGTQKIMSNDTNVVCKAEPEELKAELSQLRGARVELPDAPISGTQTAVSSPQTAISSPQAAISGPQTAISGPQSAISGPPTAISGPQISIPGMQTALPGLQAGIPVSQFLVPGTNTLAYPTDLQTMPLMEQYGHDVGYMGPAAPGAYPITQYINSPLNIMSVYAMPLEVSQGPGILPVIQPDRLVLESLPANRQDTVTTPDGPDLQQQQQQQQQEQQQVAKPESAEQQTPHSQAQPASVVTAESISVLDFNKMQNY